MKKLNKLFAILVAMAMVLSLTAVSAFAIQSGGTKDDPAKATMTKTLNAAEGISNPNTAFTFSFVQTKNSEKYVQTPVTAKENTQTVVNAGNFNRVITPNNDKEAKYTGAFADVLKDISFPAPGIYNFTVAETVPTAAELNEGAVEGVTYTVSGNVVTKVTVDGTIKTTEVTTYALEQYEVTVGVATDDGETYVESINVQKTVDEKGDPIKNPTKITDDGEPNEDGENGFNFQNKYTKKVENTNPQGTGEGEQPDVKDGKTLFISKAITVPQGENPDNNKAFQFTATVTFPTDATSYTYKIVGAADSYTESDPVTITDTKADKTETFTFELKNGERLVFTDIAIGATYKVEESSYPGYTPAYDTANIGQDKTITTDAATILDSASNYTKVTNTYEKDKDPGTGLSIANLPFIVLALVAVGGLVAYVVVRRKSEDNA